MMGTIGEVASFITSGSRGWAKYYSPTGRVFLRIQNVRNGKLELDDVVYVDPPDSQEAKRTAVQAGDVLLSITADLGRTAVVPEGLGLAHINQHLAILRLQGVNPQFVAKYLASPGGQRQFERLNREGVKAGLNFNDIRSLQIPLPPLAEQKRIAAILDAADVLRAKRREALAQLDTLLQSTFLDLFGDPVGQRWKMATVEEVARNEKNAIRTGPFGSQLLHSEFVSEGIRVLGIDNAVANEFRAGEPRFITPQKYDQLRRYTVRPGDILITIMGTCGRCAVVPDDIGIAINTKHLCCITLDRDTCLPEFMHEYFLRHPIARHYLEQSAKGAIMSGLNMGIIKNLPIPVPPLDLQRRFTAIAESIQQQKALQREHLAELDTLFASLQSCAFRGEL